jgi:hypothetical protein
MSIQETPEGWPSLPSKPSYLESTRYLDRATSSQPHAAFHSVSMFL